jgi:hypothetical protein
MFGSMGIGLGANSIAGLTHIQLIPSMRSSASAFHDHADRLGVRTSRFMRQWDSRMTMTGSWTYV